MNVHALLDFVEKILAKWLILLEHWLRFPPRIGKPTGRTEQIENWCGRVQKTSRALSVEV